MRGAVLTPEQTEALNATLVGLRGTNCDRTNDAGGRRLPWSSASTRTTTRSWQRDHRVRATSRAALPALPPRWPRSRTSGPTWTRCIQEALDLKRGNPPRTLEEISQALGTAFDELSIAKTDLDDAVEDLEDVSADVPEIEAEIDDAVDAAKGGDRDSARPRHRRSGERA